MVAPQPRQINPSVRHEDAPRNCHEITPASPPATRFDALIARHTGGSGKR
jgi:hypothetical protein